MTPTVPSPPPPILLPLSAPPPTPVPTPATLPPPEALSSSKSVVSHPPVPKKTHQMGDWLKAVITGSIIGGFILIGIVLSSIFPSIINSIFPKNPDISTTNINPEKATTPSPKSTTSPQSQTSKTPLTPIVNTISEREAKKLIETWLQAKVKMFSPPYNSQIAEQLTTGKFYEKTAGINGSINWLKNNNAYYKYGVQRLESVEQFFADRDIATIKVRITEEYSLYRNGKIDPNETDFKTLTIIYNLKLVDGQWKISNSRTL